MCYYVQPRHMCESQFFWKRQYFANFDQSMPYHNDLHHHSKMIFIGVWPKISKCQTIHIKSVLLVNLSILELRDMMAFANTRGAWQMPSWEISYFPLILVSVALGNIVSLKKHYIEEYCKPSKALYGGILYKLFVFLRTMLMGSNSNTIVPTFRWKTLIVLL